MNVDVLPFPRGETLHDGDTTVLSSSIDSGFAGRTYTVKDNLHGTGMPVVLRCVQYVGSGDLTGAQKGVSFNAATGGFLAKVDGYADAAGEVSKPLDPSYNGKTIKQYDYCYVVDEGPCTILSSATAGPAIHTPLTVAAGGKLSHATATTNNHVLGYNDIALTTANTNSAVLVYVSGGAGHEY